MSRKRAKMGNECIDTVIFGQVCDDCRGGAIMKIIVEVFQIFSMGIIVLATIGIIICGIKIITARDSAEQIAKAKKRILEIVVGIALYIMMFLIVNLFVPGGIMMSVTDSGVSYCPVATTTETPVGDTGQPGTSTPGDSGGTEDYHGRYPWATLKGQTPAGYIDCPHNANYSYTAVNPHGSTSKYDKYFQAKAASCPFTKVEYTSNVNDRACAPGDTMHYTALVQEKRKDGGIVKENLGNFCLVNSKVDVQQYQHYLIENHIGQDNKIWMPDGSEYINGDKDAEFPIKEYFHCNHFSYTFTANINSGEVVSNDMLTSKCGVGFHAAYWRVTMNGNVETTWGGRQVAVYDDNLSGIKINTSAYQPLPNPELATVFRVVDILNSLREGKAVTVWTSGTSWGSDWQHYITAVGFSKDCTIGSTAPCTHSDIVYLDSTYGSTFHIDYPKETGATYPDINKQHICDQQKCREK